MTTPTPPINPQSAINDLDNFIRSTLVEGELGPTQRRQIADALVLLAEHEQDVLLHAYLSQTPTKPPSFSVRVRVVNGGRETVVASDGLSAAKAVRRAARVVDGGQGVEVVATDPGDGEWTLLEAAPGEPLEFAFPPAGATEGPAARWAARLISWARSIDAPGVAAAELDHHAPHPIPATGGGSPATEAAPAHEASDGIASGSAAAAGASSEEASPLHDLLADPPADLVDVIAAAVAARLAPLVADRVAGQLAATLESQGDAGSNPEPVIELEVTDDVLRQFSGVVKSELDRRERFDEAVASAAAGRLAKTAQELQSLSSRLAALLDRIDHQLDNAAIRDRDHHGYGDEHPAASLF